jgi:hypothetical protein
MNQVTLLVPKDLESFQPNVEVDYLTNEVTARIININEDIISDFDRIAELRGVNYKISQEGNKTRVVFK